MQLTVTTPLVKRRFRKARRLFWISSKKLIPLIMRRANAERILNRPAPAGVTLQKFPMTHRGFEESWTKSKENCVFRPWLFILKSELLNADALLFRHSSKIQSGNRVMTLQVLKSHGLAAVVRNDINRKATWTSSDGFNLVGDERIELPQVESESTALPLCKSPIFCCVLRGEPLNVCYYTGKARSCQAYFWKKLYFFGKCRSSAG